MDSVPRFTAGKGATAQSAGFAAMSAVSNDVKPPERALTEPRFERLSGTHLAVDRDDAQIVATRPLLHRLEQHSARWCPVAEDDGDGASACYGTV